MGLLDRLFGKKKEEASVDTESLVDMIHMMVIPSYQRFLDEVPKLAQVTPEQFDFFMTNAGVCCALMGLELHRSRAEYEHALRAAESRLSDRWGEDGARAVLDCNQFVAQSLSGPNEVTGADALPAALGTWIVWNLFQEKPADEDLKLVSLTGRMAFALSSMWWEDEARATARAEEQLEPETELSTREPQEAGELGEEGKARVLEEVRQLMLDGIVEQNAIGLEAPSPVSTLKEYPEPLEDMIPSEEYPDSDIMALLARLGSHRVKRIVTSLEARVPAEDWAQNALALCYGSPGSLKTAVIKRDSFFAEHGFHVWDTELLDVVGELLQIGSDAYNIQFLHMQSPQRLKRACHNFLAQAL